MVQGLIMSLLHNKTRTQKGLMMHKEMKISPAKRYAELLIIHLGFVGQRELLLWAFSSR